MSENPAYTIARMFMARKGYKNIQPREVEHDTGSGEWLFVYKLQDGQVELIVTWDKAHGWDAYVSAFLPRR